MRVHFARSFPERSRCLWTNRGLWYHARLKCCNWETLLNWLSNHKRFATVLALAYLVANIFTHETVQHIAKWIQDSLTPAGTNTLVTVVALLLLLVAAVMIPARLRHAPQKFLKIFYCVVTAAFVVMTYTRLFMINTESIHFVQYALLAVIVFAVTPRFGETVLLVTILGAIDESYQYWVLNRNEPQYLDFNDMILNLEGAAIGVLALAVLARPNSDTAPSATYSISRFLKSPAFLMAMGIALVAGLLAVLGEVALYCESGAWVVLRSIGPPPTEFYTTSYWGKTCHVLMPWEGLLMIAGMTAFYVFLDFRLVLQFRRLR